MMTSSFEQIARLQFNALMMIVIKGKFKKGRNLYRYNEGNLEV